MKGKEYHRSVYYCRSANSSAKRTIHMSGSSSLISHLSLLHLSFSLQRSLTLTQISLSLLSSLPLPLLSYSPSPSILLLLTLTLSLTRSTDECLDDTDTTTSATERTHRSDSIQTNRRYDRDWDLRQRQSQALLEQSYTHFHSQ